ncbi:MAG: DUF4124 domain-containing protein [Rubrivivax sp.]|nr:DUF4124 domain-containing protein [Rubrivivax sp.]
MSLLRPALPRVPAAWPRGLLACAAALGLLLAVADAHAQWKWRDASGRIHLSDLPPPASVPDRDILQRPRAAASPAAAPIATAPAAPATAGGNPPPAAAGTDKAAPRTPLEAELEKKRKADEADKAAKARAEEDKRAAQRADNCGRARSALASLESGQRLSRVNEKGEREFLDDRQRAAEVQRAREVVNSDCR